jgi:hypothetical protein
MVIFSALPSPSSLPMLDGLERGPFFRFLFPMALLVFNAFYQSLPTFSREVLTKDFGAELSPFEIGWTFF